MRSTSCLRSKAGEKVYRQPLKLANLVCCSGLMRILRTDPEQQRTAVHASDGSIRTHSHTAREVLWAGRTIDGRDSPPQSLWALLRSRKAAPPPVARCRASVSLMSKQGMLLPPRMVSEPIDGRPDGVKTSVAVGAVAPSAIATLSSEEKSSPRLDQRVRGRHAERSAGSRRFPPLCQAPVVPAPDPGWP